MDAEYEKLISTPRRVSLLLTMTARLRAFIEEHQLPEPRPVICRPLPFCQPKRCFANVDQQVRRAGGTAVAGWLFWEIENTILESEAHCVWVSEHGAWIDITPQPSAPQRVLFAADPRVAQKRGCTVGYETPLTSDQKVLALQKFTRSLARIREEHTQGFGEATFIPIQLLWKSARDSGLPEDVAGFLLQKYVSWERAMEQKYRPEQVA